jgi:hypothetical protein
VSTAACTASAADGLLVDRCRAIRPVDGGVRLSVTAGRQVIDDRVGGR